MKIYLFLFLVLANFNAFAQAPAIQWTKTFGGAGVDELRVVKQTSDGGYILGGPSYSDISGDKSENSKGGDDYWVVKLDPNGNKIWDKTFGGNDGDILIDIQLTADNGYILGGYSLSNSSGDKSENSKGISDYWVVKLDANGNKIWDRTFGGAGSDLLFSLQQTTDGGYILGGFSTSDISGDKSENSKGEQDYWVIKTDANGNKIWDKTFGGADVDFLRSLQQTSDGGYILGGDSKSNISGDKSENSHGSFDMWIVKLDANGNKTWDNTIGGAGNDGLDNHTMQQTSDGGYIIGGYSSSDISGDKTENHKGFSDYWVVKLNATGAKIWDKTIGGSLEENLYSLQQTSEGGYILGGYSNSNISGDKTETSRGGHDYWVVKLDGTGNISWDKTIGGADVDILYSLQQTADGGYILGGYSRSNISGDKTEDSRGFSDYWVAKLEGSSIIDCSSSTLSVTIPNAYAINPGGNINTVYIGYQPASSITLNASPSGGNAPYDYSWSTVPSQTTQQITVSPSVAGNHEFTVTVTDASGCSATSTKTIIAMDIRTGKKLEKIFICHKDTKGKRSTISVLAGSVPEHLTHGDYLGTCEALPKNLLNDEIVTAKMDNDQVLTNTSLLKVTVGPNPNNGNFWFTVSGIEKETSATLFTIDGKVMKQFKVFNMQQEKIYGLSTGVYMLKVQGLETVKIIVQ